MQGPHQPIEIFCSYAHEDETHLQKLETHLRILKRQGIITTWYDRQITAGTPWAQAIDTHLNSASVILLLISPDFFASDYCYGIEMTRALERHQANEARVIPILLRPMDWKGAPFAHLQALPTNAKPVTSWSNRDEAWASVAVGIRRAIEDLAQLSASDTHHKKPAKASQDAGNYQVTNNKMVQGQVIGEHNITHQYFAEAGDEHEATQMAVFHKLESLMPALLAEMRKDLTEYPLAREIILLSRSWTYNGDGSTLLIYYYEDHSQLKDKMIILCNHLFLVDITYNNVKRYNLTEKLADYLTQG